MYWGILCDGGREEEAEEVGGGTVSLLLLMVGVGICWCCCSGSWVLLMAGLGDVEEDSEEDAVCATVMVEEVRGCRDELEEEEAGSTEPVCIWYDDEML